MSTATIVRQTRTSTTLRVERKDGSTFRAIVDTEDVGKILRLLKKTSTVEGRSQ